MENQVLDIYRVKEEIITSFGEEKWYSFYGYLCNRILLENNKTKFSRLITDGHSIWHIDGDPERDKFYIKKIKYY